MKKTKRKGFTRAGKQMVKPIMSEGRKAHPLSTRIISYFTGKVKQNSAVLCGNLGIDEDFDIRWERYVHMNKIKRILLIVFIWFCAVMLVCSVCSIVDIFLGGNGLWI